MELLVVVVPILIAVGVFREVAQLGAARLCGLPVDRFSVGFGPAIWKRTSSRTGTTFQITWLPFGAFVHVRGAGHAAWKRLATIVVAMAATYLAAAIVALALFASYGLERGGYWFGVASVLEGSAAIGKLEPGDRIVAVDGEPLDLAGPSLTERVAARDGAPVTLTIRRDGATRDVAIQPRRDPARANKWLLGIRPELQRDRSREAGAVVGLALSYPANQFIEELHGAYDDMFGEPPEPGGPIRIADEYRLAVAALWRHGLQLATRLGAYLALFLIGFDLIRIARLAVQRPPATATR